MIDQELIRDLTEPYLKALFAEVTGSSSDFDSFAPFGELGIDSFYVLKIIRRLEADFGTLPKSLLFERFNINDLADYFVGKHEQVLYTRFAAQLQGGNGRAAGHERRPSPGQPSGSDLASATGAGSAAAGKAASVRMLEREAWVDPEFGPLVKDLFCRYKLDAGVSRGTRKIAPNLFIGSDRRGYFNYGRSKDIILVYGYTGPPEQLTDLLEEMYRHCQAKGFQLNVIAGEAIPTVGGTAFSATPFGVMQRMVNLETFALDGGAMRRLRYQVSKFQKSGATRTEEYRCGSSEETDREIARTIDRWSEARTMVNPLVHDVKAEILAGTLAPEHRLFLTYLDGVLQNVVVITALSAEERGYLMDLEFYLPEMPLGGLEFGIVQMIDTLVAEGCRVLSLGGTYGCKLEASETADPEIDKILDDLREQNIFNDEGNLQFKNKFRPVNSPIFLCRPVGSANPDNVIDIIMMIADPDKMQTPDAESPDLGMVAVASPVIETPAASGAISLAPVPPVGAPPVREQAPTIAGKDRARVLADFGFNPLNIPPEQVDLDLKTDSWAQLATAAIDARMNHLHGQLQQPVKVEESVRAVFPFAHIVLTASGQAAEHLFFKAWPKKGIVPQNLLFPSTIFHQIDKDFTPREVPHAELFQLNSREPYKANLDGEALRTYVAQDPAAVAFVCIEVSDNAAGGAPVSLQHLRDVKALLAEHSIPLILDVTRIVENALFLIEQEAECAGKDVWTVVREILSFADAVLGSLTKDFCVNRGGIIATNDPSLFRRIEELLQEDGGGIDLIDRKLIALSLQERARIEKSVLQRTANVRLIWQALVERGAAVVQPAGGHCVLLDVKKFAAFRHFKDPVASFLAWLYLHTGIRAGAHSVGMQKNTSLNGLVRLAIPVGLKREEAERIIERLVELFDRNADIPEIVMESTPALSRGAIHAHYRLIAYHNVSAPLVEARSGTAATVNDAPPAARSARAGSSPTPSSEPAPARSSLQGGLGEAVARGSESEDTAVSRRPRRNGDVAIVGMAGRYPKARNLRELWQNLAQGRDCIEDLPADRYERRLRHGSVKKYRGGFIDDVDKFDSLFFNISPREAEMLDPQERLFLETTWEAIEDAGYYPEILAREDGSRNVGVFVGAVWAMYQMLGVEEKHAGNPLAPNSFLWSIANRVSYWFNFSGPSFTVDTACSSSLTALYLACEAIQAGDCSAAIVGGVNLDLHQAKLDINQNGGALSADGVCRSFGKGGNGYVAGEGIGALLLKPLDEAVAAGDNIYGVVKSAVINHGGRTSGYTVPNPKAQSELISAALQKARIDARSIGYIEAHGTGTELGDPIEVTGLTSAFKAYTVGDQSCALGSVKTNIGHLEAAAGVVSVSKVLLQMQHRQIAPSLHSSELNELIDFASSPFYVVQKLEEWTAKEVNGVRAPLRAGISSFGAGGANAHVILESYEAAPSADEEESAPAGELIFPLSARHEDQLRESAVRLRELLQQNDRRLQDVAYTLQYGRRSFDHRLAIVAGTQAELIAKLTGFIDGKRTEGVVAGHAKSSEALTRLLNRREREEFVRLVSQGRDPVKIGSLWAEGLLADWQGYPSTGRGRRVSLPTYPFADKRHWVSEASLVQRVLLPAASVHPMVDTNESTFERQLFKKTFHDRDFFIYDHHVSDIPTLPGVAYLELARKAGELAAGRKVQKIKNILWVSPISVQGSVPKEVFIELKPAGETVQFEVFSEGPAGNKTLHSQGKLVYATKQELAAEPEYIDLQGLRARCEKVIDGERAYPLFKSFGLNLGPSFQVLQDVYRNETEILGVLKLSELREADLQSLVLHPSLMDGSLQAGMGAQLSGEQTGEMFVPYTIGEVEILQPLQPNCFSYVTEAKDKGAKKASKVLKSNVLIVDETGKVLVRIRESVGVPLVEVHEKPSKSVDADGFERLYYAYDWEKAPLAAEGKPGSPGPLVLFATDGDLRDRYRARLSAEGRNAPEVILVQPGEAYEELGDGRYSVHPQNKDHFGQLFESLIAKGLAVQNVCFAWQAAPAGVSDIASLNEALERGVYSFLYVCQSLVKLKLENGVQLLYVHSGSEEDVQHHNEAVTGFVNAVHLEHPKLLCKTVEVRQQSPDTDQLLSAMATELDARAQDSTAVRYEGSERFIRKLKAFELEQASAAPEQVSFREQGVYLITGGAGGLGLIFADFLAKEHKARVVLTGRSRLSPSGEAKLDALRKDGADVVYLPADVSSRDDVANLIAEVRSRFGQLNGIIHAAGVLRDSFLRNKTAEEMSAVFAPKVHGTIHLDELTKDDALDFFVTFSSLAAVAGNAGQCDYSFANYFMDSFAAGRERRRARGERPGRALSVNWSLWADGGMKLDEQTERYFKKTLGIQPLSMATGIDAFVRGLASDRSQFAVLEGIQDKVEVAWGLRKKEPAPAAAPASGSEASSAADGKDGDLVARLQNDLSQIVMAFLKLDASDVDQDKILLDLGFDSIGLTTFANAINDKYQLDITPVLFFDYASIAEIAKHLAVERREELLPFYRGSGSAAAATVAQPSTAQPPPSIAEDSGLLTFPIRKGWDPASLDRQAASALSERGFSPESRFASQPIAIVGMSGVMPLSEDMDEFWRNLESSMDMVTVIPSDRWRWEDYYGDPLKEENKSNSKWGGFMREVDKFDPLFFGISPREAQMMDPQQRLFLEQVWKAVEDSGQRVSDLSGTKTGVFVGVATSDYTEVMTGHDIVLDGYTASGNSHSILANRVSFLLNLRGPSAPIDTACSSSLIALHRAIESIHTGSSEMAIVGGVHVMLSPAAYISFGMAGMLSGDGKCKSFDKRANGYVRGEGCGAIFLKPLAAAEADGNHIYAVIRATAENHGGRVTTLTAPNSAAQAELLVEAYEKARIDPATVGYIECHGTGTSLGDPIEIQAMSKAFAELYKRRNMPPAAVPHCGLSSVKTNIGHLETAAGIAGVLKVLLAIKHKQIPANIHFEELNPYINLKGTPFYVADKLTPWEPAIGEDGAPLPRRAGVSSFGFGGANAHIVLEEYIAPERLSLQAATPHLIVLSAKNGDRLTAYAQALRTYLENETVEMRDLTYTLQVGRDEMPERLALVVSGAEELKQRLDEILAGEERAAGVFRKNIRSRGKEVSATGGPEAEAVVQSAIERNDLLQLAELWVSGSKIDWRALYAPDVPRRISVPTYPFARERHWVPGARRTVIETRPDNGSKHAEGSSAGPPRQPASNELKVAADPVRTARLQSLVPVWSPAGEELREGTAPPQATRILLAGGDGRHLGWIREGYPVSHLLQLDRGASVEVIGHELLGRSFDQLLWIAPDVAHDGAAGPQDQQIIAQQEEGVMALFRLIKALLHAGYANKRLQWTIITGRTQLISEGSPMQAAHAGISGLIGSLAKEYPNWQLRLLDIDSLAAVSARECLALPWDEQGNALAHRDSRWFQQGLAPMTALPDAGSAYRTNGVYVVIGGAGGVGEVWSRFLVDHYQANIVWIGRRKYDDVIEHKINSLTRMGRGPLYISADATKAEELERALQRILKTHPVIHGVVHSAIVLHDQSIGRMDEAAFRSSLSAKVDISVNMDRVFGGLPLDFMLFFSSIISFFKSPGQSNYSAGCTFKDSFAQQLQQQRSYPVKIMNWGYWGSVGVAADEAHNKIMERMGIGSIEPQEGMESLQVLLDSPAPQMALIKTLSGEVTAGMSLSEAVSFFLGKKTPVKRTSPPVAASGRPGGPPPAPVANERSEHTYVQQIIIDRLSDALRLDAALIRADGPLADYGVDSIIGVNLVRTINEALDVDLEPMKLFEYETAEDLAAYICASWPGRIAEQAGRAGVGSDEPYGERMAVEAETARQADPAPRSRVLTEPEPDASSTDARMDNTSAEAEMSSEQLLESVLWQETVLDDGYEKVTF